MDYSRLLWRTIHGVMVAAIVCASAWAGPESKGRDPRPFVRPYHDGHVFALWRDYPDDELYQMLSRIRETGAESLQIPIYGCQSTIRSADVGDCRPSNRDTVLRSARIARTLGFSVTLLPIVITPQWDWRGHFEPDDVEAWFRTYAAWMERVAQDAVDIGSPELIAGSEFKSIYRHTDAWKTLLKRLRTIFPGPIVVTANWDELDHGFDYGFWGEADAIGVSAYYPLSILPNPSQEMLDRTWLAKRAKLLQVSERYKRPLHFTEVGYHSSTSAAVTPWTISDTPDAPLQARCFEAFRRAWSGQKSLVRASVWATGDVRSSGYATSFETLGKPAEAVLRQFFAERPKTR